MDYDDNDFQSQNFQLVGEDNNKFLSNLLSFGLPKLDLDEHLQAHLRFDSLVDTEALLGMRGQESNWIEDFAAGSAIEFSSSTADSCTISRHKNVWSEATSSESVEMLLKSVVEDEMLDKKTTITEADAQEGSGGIDIQIYPSSVQDVSLIAVREDIVMTHPALPPDKDHHNYLGLNTDEMDGQPQAAGVSEPPEVGLDVSSLVDKFNPYPENATEEFTGAETLASSSDDVTKNYLAIKVISCETFESKNPLDSLSMTVGAHDDHDLVTSKVSRGSHYPETCGTQDLPSAVSIHNHGMRAGKLSYEMSTEQVNQEHNAIASNMELEVQPPDDVQKEKVQIDSGDVEVIYQCSEDLATSNDLCNEKNSSCLGAKMDPPSEGCNNSAFSKNPDGLLEAMRYKVKVMGEIGERDDEIAKQIKKAISLAVKCDGKLEGAFTEVGNEDIVRPSHLTSLFKNDGHGEVVNIPKTDGSQISSTPLAENTLMIADYGQGIGCDTLIEEVLEKQEPSENANSHVDSTSGSAAKLHSSIHVRPKTPSTNIKDDGGIGYSLSKFTSQNLESVYLDKCIENEVDEKSCATLKASEVIIVKKSSPVVLNCKCSKKLHSSIHVTPETPLTNIKDDGGVGYSPSKFTSQNLESVYLDECVENEVDEKSDATLNASEVITVEKSSLVVLNCKGSKIPSPDSKAFGRCETNSLVGTHCDASAFHLGDSILQNRNTEPGTSDTTRTNDVVFTTIVMEKKADASPSGQNAATSNFVNDLSAKVIQVESERKGVTLPSFVTDSVHSDEEEVTISGSKSIADSQNSSKAVSMLNPVHVDGSSLKNVIQNESFTSPAESAELTCQKELANVDISHSENTTISNIVVEQEGPTSHLTAPDIIQTNEGGFITSEITWPPSSAEPASQDERQATPVRPSKSSMESYQENAENGLSNKSPKPFTLSESNGSNPSLDAGSSSPNSLQPSGSLPIIVSCSELPQGKTECRVDNRSLPLKGEFMVKTGSNKISPNADKDESTVHDSKDSGATVIDKSFTFEVGSLAELSKGNAGSGWKRFTNIESVDIPQTPREKSQEGHIGCGKGKHHDTITKKTKEKKTVAISGHSTRKVNASKKKPAKEASVQKQISGSEGIICNQSPISVGSISRDIQLEQMRQYAYESSSKACCFPAVQAPSLPDLNTTIAAASLIHQPFTDLQQAQLRAQIFVYGSLIQGAPPEEACMISAFGDAGGGRNLWDAAWHAAVERFQNQNSPLSNCETPINSRSGILIPQQAIRCSSLESKTLSPHASWTGTKVTSVALSSTMPLPSPLWNISSHDGSHSNVPRGTYLDFSQVLSPAYSYQPSQVRPYLGNDTPSLSQTTHPGSLVIPAQSLTLNATSNYSTVPITDTIRATPTRGSSVLRSPSMQIVAPGALLPASGPPSVSAASIGQSDAQKKAVSLRNMKNVSTASRSRKKKVTVPEEPGSIFTVSQALADPGSVAGVAKHLPVSTGVASSASYSVKVLSGSLPSATSHSISPAHYQIAPSCGVELKAVFSEEACCKIEQAKLQAEDAAAFAALAVRHSEGIWSQLATQKNSGLVSEIEEKLASAAVAATAAASVAKAAAAAARIASDAALQAKMMADEALNSFRTGDSSKISDTPLVDVGKSIAKLIPVSISKGKDNINGRSSILPAACQAAKRRLEAASAATKRAENMDGIVKAAELAAEAVSQAGAIIAMGEPLPFSLSELVEHGPEGYWRFHHSSAEKHSKVSSGHEKWLELEGNEDHDIPAKQLKERPSRNNVFKNNGYENGNNKSLAHSEENYADHDTGNKLGNVSSTVTNVKDNGDHLASNLVRNIIQKGSLVEVISDEDGLRGVWFSACVLDVKDGKTYVCYNDLLCDGGSGQLKEWIPLDAEGNEAPRIRTAHPDTVTKSGRTRKRQRPAPNCTWAVGDHVDARIRDGWWEGIITEKNKDDETKLTVHYPAGGDSSTVRTWNLRPSLVWKDGQWTEWMRLRENYIHEGDTPKEKRQRIGMSDANIESEVDGGIGKLSKDLHSEGSRKPEESRSLLLSAKDKKFSVGKNGREENNVDSLKVKRTGLWKEGSRVVFGVPKPGKGRKFMEVSKHFVRDKSDKISLGNDSVKFAKYLTPQELHICGNASQVDLERKEASDPKPRGLKLVKSHYIQNKSISNKDNSSIATLSASSGRESDYGSFPSTRPFSNEGNVFGKNNEIETGPTGSSANSIVKADNPVVESSVQLVPGISSSKKSSLALESERGVKRKHKPPFEKSTRSEEKGSENPERAITDGIEPRRSGRRIQPTSRLLLGLQSSLLISKIPSFSHDRGVKAMHRGGSSSRGKTRG